MPLAGVAYLSSRDRFALADTLVRKATEDEHAFERLAEDAAIADAIWATRLVHERS